MGNIAPYLFGRGAGSPPSTSCEVPLDEVTAFERRLVTLENIHRPRLKARGRWRFAGVNGVIAPIETFFKWVTGVSKNRGKLFCFFWSQVTIYSLKRVVEVFFGRC